MPPPQSAHDFLDFVNACPSAYHAVATSATLLEKAGFVKIRERDEWAGIIKPGGKYYLTRNGASIVAFAVGGKWEPGNPFAMVCAHTDSPHLRVKPVSRKSAVGYMQVGVEAYGGGIWHSWFDRDLGVAGRVLVREQDGSCVPQLARVDKAILRIPHLAIHLSRDPVFNPNKETELFPIAGLAEAELNRPGGKEVDTADGKTEGGGAEGEHFQPLKAMSERHHSHFVQAVAESLAVEPSRMVNFELALYDTQKACLGGLGDEFILSARLDNLNSTFCAIRGLVASVQDASGLSSDPTIRLFASFDNEEVGSQSAHGAQSNLLPAVTRRLSELRGVGGKAPSPTAFEQSMSASFLISADMAHAVHPNYEAKHEARHQPAINGGPVIKVNSNTKYATDGPGIALVTEAARRAAVPLQFFVVRNDSPCGSTIGPMLSAAMGLRTLDIGNPQLAMHSIRETGGTYDVEHSIKLFASFYTNYAELDAKIVLD